MNNKYGVKGKKLLLWSIIGVVVLLCLAFILEYYTDFNQTDGERDLFTLSGQENLAVSDGRLYYCDVLKENALCSYHLETKEILMIEEAEGKLKKTGTGVYYIVENAVYRIVEDDLLELFRIPAKNFTFIDCCGDIVYWIARETKAKEKEESSYTLEYLYAQKISSETEPKLLFHQEDEDVRDAVVARDCIYLMTDKGIYCTEPGKEELKKISDYSGLKFYGDGICIFIKEKADTAKEGYFEVTPEGQLKRLTGRSGLTATIFEGEIYYPWNNYLWKKNLGKEEEQEYMLAELPGYAWYAMEAYEEGVFMRGYLSYDIWYYDISSDTSECIIKQREE